MTSARRRPTKAGGQIVITFALMLALFLFGLMVTVVDLAALYGAQTQVAKAAEDGAVAGAAMVNETAFITSGGTLQLNGATAPTACKNAIVADLAPITGSNPSPCAQNGPITMTATVTLPVALPIPIPFGFASVTVGSTFSATALCGTTQNAAVAGGFVGSVCG